MVCRADVRSQGRRSRSYRPKVPHLAASTAQKWLPSGVGDHEVRVVGVGPLNPAGAQSDEPLDFPLLLLLAVHPEVEVGPVLLVEVEAWTIAAGRDEERGVPGRGLVAERRGPEPGGAVKGP